MSGTMTPYARIDFENPLYVYGLYLQTPRTIVEYFDDAADDSGATKFQCYIDPNARVLTAQPTPNFQDMVLTDWTLSVTPSTSSSPWFAKLDPSTAHNVLLMDDATDGVYCHAVQAVVPGGGNPTGGGKGYFVRIQKGVASQDAARIGGTLSTPTIYWRWYLGTDWRITAATGFPFILERYNGTTWKEVKRTKNITDCEQYLDSNNRSVLITVLFYPSRKTVSIYIGNGDGDLSYTDTAPIVPAGAYSFESKNGKVSFQKTQIVYPSSFTYKSGLKFIGYVPSFGASPQLQVWPRPDPTSSTFNPATTLVWHYPSTGSPFITMTYATDLVLTDHLTFTIVATIGTSDPTFTPVLEWASVGYPGVVYNGASSRAASVFPKQVQVDMTFNPNTLAGRATAHVDISNRSGINTGFSGIRAAVLVAGWKLADGTLIANNIMTGYLGPNSEFNRKDPVRWSSHTLFDRLFWMDRKQCGILPWLDGWPFTDAARYLFKHGNFLSDSGTFDWLTNIPSYGEFPTPPGCPIATLPVGTGIKPRWRPNPTSLLVEELQRIATQYRQVYGADANGNAVFTDYTPSGGPAYTGSIGTTGGTFQFGGPAGLSGINGRALLNEAVDSATMVSRSCDDIRSGVTLIGIDPSDWQALVAHNTDYQANIVFNPDSPNFTGMFNELVDIDPVYTDLSFMNARALDMATQAAIPTLNIQHQHMFHPKLFLQQRYLYQDTNTIGPDPVEFKTIGVTHHIGINTKNRTIIRGKATSNV